VVAGTASVVAGGVRHRQEQRWARQEQEQYDQQVQAEQAAAYQQQQAAQQAAPPQQAGAAEPDYMAELERLAQLKNQGIITEDEFQAKKRQLLGI
jgi:hypothetical protein